VVDFSRDSIHSHEGFAMLATKSGVCVRKYLMESSTQRSEDTHVELYLAKLGTRPC
jgi:hypothetical protein